MAVFAFRLVFLTVFVAMVVGSGFLDTGDQDRYLEYLLRRTLDARQRRFMAVTVDKEVKSDFNDLMMMNRYRWIIFKLSDDFKTIVTDVKDSGAHCFDEFLGKLKESGEPRYAVYDVHMKTVTGEDKSKIVFISWFPKSATHMGKIVYAASKDIIKKGLIFEAELQKTEDISFREELVQTAIGATEDADILPELQEDCA